MENSNSKDGSEVPQSTEAGVPTERKTIDKPHAVGSTAINESCPEFPYFGAKYPDATCIDGYLWDLDKCDESGMLYGGGDEPCPFCNTETFIEQNIDDDEELEENEKITRQLLLNYVEKLREKYG